MTKRLIDIDDDFLESARAELGLHTLKDTVNEALRRASGDRAAKVVAALDALASADLDDRETAWR